MTFPCDTASACSTVGWSGLRSVAFGVRLAGVLIRARLPAWANGIGSSMPFRMQWSSLPLGVKQWVEQELGGHVVSAATQANGFSSGSADRIQTENGRGAFVKAVSRARNAGTFELHRREASVMRILPPEVRVPQLLGVFDNDEWVALLLAEVDGEHPDAQRDEDIPAVLDALAALPVARGPLIALPRLQEELPDDFDGWLRLVEDGVDSTLPPLALKLQDQMIDASTGALEAVDGNYLVHLDCRADNLLLDRTGAAWILDWPWAAVGARWLDGLTFLLDVVMRAERVDVDQYLGHPVFDEMAPANADAVLAGLAGAWYDKARQPALADMPTIRAFQKAEADAAVTWLSHRWS